MSNNMGPTIFVFMGLVVATLVDFFFQQTVGRSICSQARDNFFKALDTFIDALKLILYTDEERAKLLDRSVSKATTANLDALIDQGVTYLGKATDLAPEAA